MTEDDDLAFVAHIIRRMPDTHRELGDVLAAGGGGGYRERVTSSKVEAPSPINEDAAQLRGDIIEVMASWADNVVQDAELGPAISRQLWATTVLILSLWRWVEVADWRDDFASEILDLHKRADAILDPPERMPVADRIHEGLIDGRDVATVTGVSPSRVRQWVLAGDLEVAARGAHGRNLYRVDDIRALKLKRDIEAGVVDMAA